VRCSPVAAPWPAAAARRARAPRRTQPRGRESAARTIPVKFEINTIQASPPPAAGGAGKWFGGFELTEYYPALEAWFVGAPVDAPGLAGRHRIDWLYSAHGLSMEGDGVGPDGRQYHVADLGSGGWLTAGELGTAQFRPRRRTVPAHRRLLAQRLEPAHLPARQPHLHPRLPVDQRRLVRSRRHRRRDHRQPHRRVPATALESARHEQTSRPDRTCTGVPPGVPLP
jgi:hypothetical protein